MVQDSRLTAKTPLPSSSRDKTVGLFESVQITHFRLAGVQAIVRRTFIKSLIAVLAGNIIYYFLLMPLLPPAGRHRPGHLDLGLIIDFWLCLVILGLLELRERTRARKTTRT
jgi:hypothetical protein